MSSPDELCPTVECTANTVSQEPCRVCPHAATRQSKLELTPTTLADAKAFVKEVHRHHGPPVGHRFSVGCKDDEGVVRAVMVMGRAVAPATDQYAILEVTRLTNPTASGRSRHSHTPLRRQR